MISIGAQALGRAASILPDIQSARDGAVNIFKTLDRQTLLPVDVGEVPTEPFKGDVEFRNVRFAYPTRPKYDVLKVRRFII